MSSILEVKIGSGFTFLIFMFLATVYAFYTKAPYLDVAGAWGVGLTFHQGQRAYTQVQAMKRCNGNGNTDTQVK